jgi:flagellar protein FliS
MPTATAYVNDSIGTAGPAQLVLALYDAALGAIDRARTLLEASASVETIHIQLVKAQRIVTELNVTLDHERGGDIAANLGGLYDFCLRYLVEANLTKDPAKLPPVTDVLRGLRQAWAQACC